MADKKAPESAEEEQAIKKIDAMMSMNEKDGTPAVSTSIDTDKFKKAKTAPKLPEVYKPKETAKPPIVIKLADDKKPDPAVTAPAEPAPPKPDQPEQVDAPAPGVSITPDEPAGSADIEDSETDKAVDDIAAKESDMVLAVEDARNSKKGKPSRGSGPGWKAKLKDLFKNKWTWVGIVILLLVVFALPLTRYKILGLFLKEPVTVTVLDSKTGTPVSSAEVTLAGDTVKTDGEGQAHLKAGLGKRTLTVSKQYYTDLSTSYFVGFKKPGQPTQLRIVATGRLVPVTVLNSITGKPLGGVDVEVKNTSAKTNSKGVATIALPTTATTYSAKLSSSGYNPATVTVQVTDRTVKANSFNLTPSGQIYFLSNASGTIDVVKSNLDGTDRKTILAGTGHEDPNSTSLLASRDWQFLVLDSKRDGTHETLTLIDTSDDKTVSFDNTTSDFQLIGWSNHYFMYDLVKSNQQIWQPGNEVIKSYDAEHQQLNQLDQSQAQGDPSTSYYFQRFSNFYIVDGSLVYLTQWDTGNSISPDYTGKLNTIRAVQPNGQNKKDYLSLSPSASTFGEVALYSPQAVYFSAFDTSSNPTYYDFEDLAAKPVKLDNSIFSQTYPTWLQSPSGNQTFWTELRDGKNTLFTGNSSAGNKKQIATNSDFTPYGWFSDNYLLVSKNSSELYVIPAGGLSSGQQPLKISNYYKPARTFNGYGGGYGGQ